MTTENLSYWKKRASEIKRQPNSEWIDLLEGNLRSCHPKLMAEMAANGDLEAYLHVRVDDAMQDYRQNINWGMDPATAEELVMADLLQPQEQEAENSDED